MVEIRLLGAVELSSAHGILYAGPPRQRAVLAALAVDAGRPVPVETLTDRVWGNERPKRVQHALQVYVSRLRGIFDAAGGPDPAELIRRTRSYVLELSPDRVDALRFQRLLGTARRPDCPEETRLMALRESMGLWRGVPLVDVPSDWAGRTCRAWTQHRIDAVAAWAEAELRAGNESAVIGPLAECVAEYPAAERVVAQLMYALSRAGRLADALEYFAVTRSFLHDEIGADPGPDLTAAHQALLQLTVTKRPPPGTGSGPDRATVRPAQLPFDVTGFFGRGHELATMDRLEPGAICVVSGMAGIGKTALAVHWGHLAAGRFPDGQLYLDLRGFQPADQAMSVAEALRVLLTGLGVPAERVPPDLSAQQGLYRTAMARRRSLVLLDNARDADQVRDLLPGSDRCTVIVTSRQRLSGLMAGFGATPLSLDLLSADESMQLLAKRIGAGRVASEPAAATELIALCGRLPLALAIAAARAAGHPRLALVTLTNDVRSNLDAFADGDPKTDLRLVFSWSYRILNHDAACLFRRLGLHPGPDIAGAAVAALTGWPQRTIITLAGELERANLLIESSPGRFKLHDLLRTYAAELGATEAPADLEATVSRAVDYYLHSAHAADRLIQPARVVEPLPPVAHPIAAERFTDQAEALAWFTAEHSVLLSVIRWAATAGLGTQAWHLIWSVDTFLERRGHWHDWLLVHRIALDIARAQNDPARLASTEYHLGRTYAFRGQYDEAHDHLARALQAHRESGDAGGQARVYLGRGWVYERQGHHQLALDDGLLALELYTAADDLGGQALALNNVGSHHTRLKNFRAALDFGRRALAIHDSTGDVRGQADTYDTLGYTHQRLGEYDDAITHYGLALKSYRGIGNRHGEAETLHHLGDTHADARKPDLAASAWRQALAIYEPLQHPDADRIRARLSLDPPMDIEM